MQELEKQQKIENNILIYREAKQRVQGVVDAFKKVAKKVKMTKQSKKALKLMEDFIKCNITSPAIVYKYEKVVELLAQYGKKEDSENVDTE